MDSPFSLTRSVVFAATCVYVTLAALVIPSNPKRWGTLTIKFAGPRTGERARVNPFLNFRLDVSFKHTSSGYVITVPGFYAADGNAAQTGATSGNIWMVRFSPGRTGPWSYYTSFRTGRGVAVNREGGTPISFHGASGTFSVSASTYGEPDLRAKGRLRYVGRRYFQYANGEYKLKLGTNTPENFLGYTGFDGETGFRHSYRAHKGDWRTGDPTWGADNRGKEIIGAINYLASQHVNSLFSILMTVEGDSKGDVHPWITQKESSRYDVSKLEQWQIVFDHATKRGLSLNLAFLETENEALFEYRAGASTKVGFAGERKLFYREIIARFAHNVGLMLTLGEENGWSEGRQHGGGKPWGVGNTPEQRRQFTQYIRSIDPYNSPIAVHTLPTLKEAVYSPMLGFNSGARVESASLQMSQKWRTRAETAEWIKRSARAGKPWVVTADEVGADYPGGPGGVPLGDVLPLSYRADIAWGNLLTGGGGMEVFTAKVDQSLDDFRKLSGAWREFSRPVRMLKELGIPFYAMVDSRAAVQTRGRGGRWLHALGKAGDMYVIYVSGPVEIGVDLRKFRGYFKVRWFDPMGTSMKLWVGGKAYVRAGGIAWLGQPPRSRKDWAIVVARDTWKGN